MVHEVAPLPNPALQPGQALIAELMGGNVGAWLHDGFILSERLPMIRSAMARSNGHVLLMQLAASLRVEPDGSATAAVPYAEQAPQLRVARGTLRNRLAQWQRAGLLELAPGGRQLRLSPGLVAVCRRWVAHRRATAACSACGCRG